VPQVPLSRIVGIARSLAIYHAVPFRQRRLRRLYAQLVPPGSLVFDIGAHAGNRTRALAALGCRVVAVEPQPDFVRLLRALFRRSPLVTVVAAAVSAESGRTVLWASDRTPTVTTIDPSWREERRHEAAFASVRWSRAIEVETTTLDRLMATFGRPAFVKIDVEGAEPDVLAGLSWPVPVLSFEYLPQALDRARRAVSRLEAIGPYRFNWSPGESYRLAASAWLRGEEVLAALARPAAGRTPGDIYAIAELGNRGIW
jgi:FkbM family methyltransferase